MKKHDYAEGEFLTYFPSPEFVGDNRHWECVIKSFASSGRYARIEFDASEGHVTRTVPLSRLKRQGLLPVAA